MTALDREVPPELTAYAMGLSQASVCTTLGDEEATARLNAEHPTGHRLAVAGVAGCDVQKRHLLFEC